MASGPFLSGTTTAEESMDTGSLNAVAYLETDGFPVYSNRLHVLERAIPELLWHRIPSQERST